MPIDFKKIFRILNKRESETRKDIWKTLSNDVV